MKFKGGGKLLTSKFDPIDDPGCVVLLLFVVYGSPVIDGASPLHSPGNPFCC